MHVLPAICPCSHVRLHKWRAILCLKRCVDFRNLHPRSICSLCIPIVLVQRTSHQKCTCVRVCICRLSASITWVSTHLCRYPSKLKLPAISNRRICIRNLHTSHCLPAPVWSVWWFRPMLCHSFSHLDDISFQTATCRWCWAQSLCSCVTTEYVVKSAVLSSNFVSMVVRLNQWMNLFFLLFYEEWLLRFLQHNGRLVVQ